MQSTITGSVSITAKRFLVLMTLLCWILLSTNTSAKTAVTFSDFAAEVLCPQDGQIFWVQRPSDVFNLTASGKGHINYVVSTDNNPLGLYEQSWMYLDSYVFHASDPIVFEANTTTNRNWSISSMAIAGSIGVGQHTATSRLLLTYLDNTEVKPAVPDTHHFEVKVVPAPPGLLLGGLGLATAVAGLKRKRLPKCSGPQVR